MPASEQFNFSNSPTTLARTIAESYTPGRVVVYEGDINVVATADEQVSVKVPRQDDDFARDAFMRELRAYQLLANVDVSPISVPRIVAVSSDPAYLVATYVPGQITNNDEVRALAESSRAALGKGIGRYIARQYLAVDLGSAQEALPAGAPYTLASEFDLYLRDFRNRAYPTLGRLANTLYERWYVRHIEEPDAFIHGDLQPSNVTLDEDANLQGVFDFGRATTGKISEELSAFCAVDPVLFDNCVRQLEAEGLYVDRDQALLWREMRDLIVLPYWITQGKVNNRYFRQFRTKVVERYPQFNWRELYTAG